MSDVGSPSNEAGHAALEGRNVCVIYDCLFPLTHGGAERWYRCLVDRFIESGANVTYLTRRQWTGDPPPWSGVRIVNVSGAAELYDEDGVRRTGPAVVFGIGTFVWLLRHRKDFDAVVVASFPFFSLLAARAALAGTRTPLFVDYHEVWSPEYWRLYAGRVTGTIGSLVQRLCIAITPFAQVFTSESSRRLRSLGFKGDVLVLSGLLPDGHAAGSASGIPTARVVLFVGRHVKHKGVQLLPEIFASALESMPDLRMEIVGDGPERSEVEREVNRRGLSDAVTFRGSVSDAELRRLYSESSCTIVPSLREGYGIVVAESAAAGTPVVVANNPENLATGLVEQGINGFVVAPSVQGMSEGILAAIDAGQPLRQSTAEWSLLHSDSKSMDRSANEMTERLARFIS